MDHVEEAQRELGRAAAEPCSVRGTSGAWRKVGSEYERVPALWRALARFLGRHGESLGLDEIAAEALATTAVERKR